MLAPRIEPKERSIDGDECDVLYARHCYSFTKRAGVCKRVKRKINRRFRRRLKLEDVKNDIDLES